jgi:hypothetical protein
MNHEEAIATLLGFKVLSQNVLRAQNTDRVGDAILDRSIVRRSRNPPICGGGSSSSNKKRSAENNNVVAPPGLGTTKAVPTSPIVLLQHGLRRSD